MTGAQRVGVDIGSTWVRAAVDAPGGARALPLDVPGPADACAVRPVLVLHPDGRPVLQDGHVDDDATGVGDLLMRVGDPTPVSVGGVPFDVTELLAAVLAPAVRAAVVAEASDVVVLAPTYWGGTRRDRLVQAAVLAGVPDARVVPAAVAVAARHGRTHDLGDGARVAVYDLGGHAFACAVVERVDGVWRTTGCVDGVERLGGEDLDDALVRHLDTRTLGAVAAAVAGDPGLAAGLRAACRRAREQLSDTDRAVVTLPVDGVPREQVVTRPELEALAAPLVDVTLEVLDRACGSAGTRVRELDAVVAVGGVSATPYVVRALREHAGERVHVPEQPGREAAVAAAELAAGAAAPVTPPARPGAAPLVAPEPQEAPPLVVAAPAASSVVRGPGRRDRARQAVPVLLALVLGVAVGAAGTAAWDGDAADGPVVTAAPRAAVPPEPLTQFATSFEDGQPQPLANARVSSEGVAGICCDVSGFESRRAAAGPGGSRSGEHLLLYSGVAEAPWASATSTVLDLPRPTAVTEDTTLSWFVWPEALAGWPDTAVVLDVRFTDGTWLSDLSPLTTSGVAARPGPLAAALTDNTWQQVVVDVGTVAAGREAEALAVHFDDAEGAAGPFRGFIDDVRLGSAPS